MMLNRPSVSNVVSRRENLADLQWQGILSLRPVADGDFTFKTGAQYRPVLFSAVETMDAPLVAFRQVRVI